MGFLFSFGIFFPVFMDYFHESREKTGKLHASLHADAIYRYRRQNKLPSKKELYKLPARTECRFYSALITKINFVLRL